MKKWQYLLLAVTAAAVFVLVYSVHFDYHLPFHMDEWHHLSSALRLGAGEEYLEAIASGSVNRDTGLEIGFQYFLRGLSAMFDVVAIYQFLPALWAVLTALTLFFVAYKKSGNHFLIAWLAMVFFATIKSNVNVMGIWFFTPLTFSLPLILLYLYFFSEGVEKAKNGYVLAGLGIMILLIPIHAISVLFAVPALLIYCSFHLKELKRFPWLFMLAPIFLLIGLIFFKSMLGLEWGAVLPTLASYLAFNRAWTVFDAGIGLTDLYSIAGIFLAGVGSIFIVMSGKWKQLGIFLIWPAAVGIMLIIYAISGVSYLSPFQRNLYYFVLALPLLSAYGLYALVQLGLVLLAKAKLDRKQLEVLGDAGGIALIIAVLIASFSNYYDLRPEVRLYRAANDKELKMLEVLAGYPRGVVMAPPQLSLALYPIAHQDPVGDLYFYGNRADVDRFYSANKCIDGRGIIKKYQAQYIISPFEINCRYTSLIKIEGANWLYKVDLDFINSRP